MLCQFVCVFSASYRYGRGSNVTALIRKPNMDGQMSRTSNPSKAEGRVTEVQVARTAKEKSAAIEDRTRGTSLPRGVQKRELAQLNLCRVQTCQHSSGCFHAIPLIPSIFT